MSSFSELIDSLRREGDGFCVEVGDDWLQGRTVYGGLGAALCLESARRFAPDLPPLRSAQFVFLGPATGLLRFRPTALRHGKSTLFMSVDLEGEAGLATRATFCFGRARDSAVTYRAIAAPNVKPPHDCPSFFERAPPALAFVRQIEGRFAAGHLPLSRAAEATMTLWLRHRDEAVRPSLVPVLALADAPPPAAFALFPDFAPISTMTWAIDMLTDRVDTEGGWWLVRTAAETVVQGYSSQAMTVWNARGEAVMTARQNIAVFV